MYFLSKMAELSLRASSIKATRKLTSKGEHFTKP
jgi:hypothetical protein